MQPRWIALTAIWFYWSSHFWLRPLLSYLEIRPADYPGLQTALRMYSAPLRYLVPWMPALVGRSARTPARAALLAAMVGAGVCLLVWAVLVMRAHTRRTMKGR
jgi:hypothetical protein